MVSTFRLSTEGNWSGGGGVLVRNLQEMLQKDQNVRGESIISLIPRNVANIAELRAGHYVLIPQNALPWAKVPGTPRERSKMSILSVWTTVSARRARGVVRISEAIKLESESSRSSVVHNVLDSDFETALASRSSFDCGRPYIATVGSLHSYRNVPRLISAFKRYRATGGNLDLVIAGWPHPSIVRRLTDLCNRVTGVRLFAEELSRPQTLSVFESARGIIFPSLAEASPLSLLEALALNDNVAASDIVGHDGMVSASGASLAANAVFNPLSVQSIQKALCTLEDGSGSATDITWRTRDARALARSNWCSRMSVALAQATA